MSTEVFNTEKAMNDALSEESIILREFQEFKFPKHPMKVKKLALRMLRERTNLTDLQIQMITDIAVAKNSAKKAQEFIDRIQDCAIVIKDLIEDGCHGMIMLTGDRIYPIKLDTRENWLDPEKPWDIEDEKLIGIDAVDGLMKELDVGYLYAKVILFPQFGFSGYPRMVELKCHADVSKLRKVPGTKYFTSR